jgi:aspartate kinase
MRTLITKFGGTSVGDAAAIKQAVGLVGSQVQQGNQVVVVVSAMAGITNQLIACAQQAAKSKNGSYFSTISAIGEKFEAAINQLFDDELVREELRRVVAQQIDQLGSLCLQIKQAGFIPPRLSDQVNAIGELTTIQIVSAALAQSGLTAAPVDASKLVLTDDVFTNATPIQPDTGQRLRLGIDPMIESGIVPVVSGFIGATAAGEITTLGRGGSDYTAAILGAALGADQVLIWTDVDGVMTTDPEDVSEARLISSISYDEVFELAHFGAKVLHPKTIQPLREQDIPILVKNTFNPEGEGTYIASSAALEGPSLKAVTGIKQVSVIAIKRRPGEEGKEIIDAAGSALRKHGLEVLRAFQKTEDAVIYLAVAARINQEHLSSIEESLAQQLPGRNFPRLNTLDNLSLITAVGNQLLQNKHLVTRLNMALDLVGVGSFTTGLQTSPNSLSFLVPNGSREQVIEQFHNEVLRHAAI